MIAKISSPNCQTLQAQHPRALDDDHGGGIKSITYANWMLPTDENNGSSYISLLNHSDDIKSVQNHGIDGDCIPVLLETMDVNSEGFDLTESGRVISPLD